MSAKGSENERDLAKALSEWWTPGKSDTFWRVLGSGSRAKSRGRKGLDTYGSAGDIVAVDPIGTPFTEMFVVEAKKGYPTAQANPFEAVDRIKPLIPTKKNFDGWIKQVEESCEQAKTPYWMIVFRRSRRKVMACMPLAVVTGSSLFTADERYQIKISIVARVTLLVDGQEKYLMFCPLDELLCFMTPDMVRRANKRRQRG